MKNIALEELKNYYNEEVEICGFIDKIRDLQYVQFLILKDRTGKVQVTIEKNKENELLNEIVSNLNVESTVTVIGKLVENQNVKLNKMEVLPKSIIETSKCLEELPINYKEQSSYSMDTKLDYRFLDLRNEKNILMFQIQSLFIDSMRRYLIDNKFTEIHTPKFIATASESGSEVFEVKYFDKKAYLAQSPQFYKQMAMASGFEKIFEIAPVFRAENSNTNRHATEFTSFDVEFSYINSYTDVMDLEEKLLYEGLLKVKEVYGEKIKEVFNVDVHIPKLPFPRIKLQDLYKELEKRYGYKIPSEDIGDMNAETEKLTYKYAMEEFDSEFIFVTDFNKSKRAFYHMRKCDIPQGYDLIWKGMEITTGAQREHRYEILKNQALEKGLNDDVKFYLDFFKYGCPPHGGFALGVDRITLLLLNLNTVKESMFIFRGPNRLNP